MADQMSPARQAKTASSHRPAKTAAQFLNDATETRQAHDACRASLFLLDHAELCWIPAHLCRTLRQRGHSSELRQLREPASDGPSPYSQIDDCEYCLVCTTSAATVRTYNFDHVVLLVPTSLEAVLSAYRRIKQLARRNTPDIGVVMVGALDQHSAWHYFRKLAVGALRYLDVPLLNLGFIPEQISPGQESGNHCHDDFVARIGERLLRSEFYTTCAQQILNPARE